MNHRKASTRIGNAEREAAQHALQEHLNAGRLQINEYAERSAQATEAMTASDIAVLFTDLPAPRPKLPGVTDSPLGGMLRNPVVIGATVLLALAGLALGVAFSGGQDPAPVPVPAPTPTVRPLPTATTTTPVIRPTTSAAATASPEAGVGGSAAPDGVEVRRTTGDGAITLRPSYGADLDNNTSDNWAVANVGGANNGRDVGSASNGRTLYFNRDHAVVTGAVQYATCARETAYTRGGIELGSLQPGDNICVHTSEDRYALVTIVAAGEQAVQFRAVVWEPVVPS